MPELADKRSIAVAYDISLPAPIIVAKGRGRAAERIEKLADAAGVPIVRDGIVYASLEPLDLGEFVPPEYWEIVARVLVFIRKVRK